MKRKFVMVGPSLPLSLRAASKQGSSAMVPVNYQSATTSIHIESRIPSDVHQFFELYEENENHPYYLCYKCVSDQLHDLTEYQDYVNKVDFAGRISSIQTCIDIIQRLPKCKEVEFVLGDSSQRNYLEHDDKQNFLIHPINHITKMRVKFLKSTADDSKILAFVQHQIKQIFHQARYNFPNLEDLEVCLPGSHETYKIVSDCIPHWKRLKFNYDVQIFHHEITVQRISPRMVPETPSMPQNDTSTKQCQQQPTKEQEKQEEPSKEPEPVNKSNYQKKHKNKISYVSKHASTSPTSRCDINRKRDTSPEHQRQTNERYGKKSKIIPSNEASKEPEQKNTERSVIIRGMEQYTDEEEYDDEYSEDEEYKSYDAEEGYQNYYPYYDYNEEEERDEEIDVKPVVKPQVDISAKNIRNISAKNIMTMEDLSIFQQSFTRREPKPEPSCHPETLPSEELVIPIHSDVPILTLLYRREASEETAEMLKKYKLAKSLTENKTI